MVKTCDLIFEGMLLKTLRPKLELQASLIKIRALGFSDCSLGPGGLPLCCPHAS